MSAPLDSLESAANLARVRLLDAIQSLAGEVLTDEQPFTITYINGGWRRLQETLVSYGVTWLKAETIMTAVAAAANTDPGVQVYINWDGYFDGNNLLPAPVLPQNFITPLVLWERANGSGGSFLQMDRLDNGLPAVVKTARSNSWEWRNGAIYLPGSTVATDIRTRYAAYFPDFVADSDTAFADQPIPILRAMNPLAWFICSEVAKARGDLDAEMFDRQALQSTQFFFGLDALQGKSIAKESEYTDMTSSGTRMDGPSGPRMGTQ